MKLNHLSSIVFISCLIIANCITAASGSGSALEFRLLSDKETINTDTLIMKKFNAGGGTHTEKVYALKPPLLNYNAIKYATTSIDSVTGFPAVRIYFNDEGKTALYKITHKYLLKTMAIVIENEVVSTGVIREVISGGEVVISPLTSEDVAQEIADKINHAIGAKEPPRPLKQRDPPAQAYRCYAIEIHTAAINTCIEHNEILNQQAQSALTAWLVRNKTIAEQYSKECYQDIRSRAINNKEFEAARKKMEKAKNIIFEGIKALPFTACEEMIKKLEDPQHDLTSKRYK